MIIHLLVYSCLLVSSQSALQHLRAFDSGLRRTSRTFRVHTLADSMCFRVLSGRCVALLNTAHCTSSTAVSMTCSLRASAVRKAPLLNSW